MEPDLEPRPNLGTSLSERVQRLEIYYVQSVEHFVEIKEHLARQNGRLDDHERFKIQVQAILAAIGFVLSLSITGTVVMLLAGLR